MVGPGNRGDDRVPPQSLSVISGSPRRVAASGATLLWLAVPSKTSRRAIRPTGSATPPRGSSTAWYSPPGVPKRDTSRHAFLGLPLHSCVFPASPGCTSSGTAGLSRGFRPLGATQKRRATYPGASNSGSRCVPAVHAGSDALPSRRHLPVLFFTGRALGVPLSQSTSPNRRSPGLFDPRLLPATWAGAIGIGTGGPARPPGNRPVRLSASGPCMPPRTRRRVHDVPRGLQIRSRPSEWGSEVPSLQGLDPAAGGKFATMSPWPPANLPALPGVHSSLGAFPSRPWPFPGAATRPSPLARALAATPGILARTPPLSPGCRGSPASASSPVLTETCPSGFVTLYYRVSKNRESAGLFRGCGPSEVSLLVRGFPRLPGSPAGVGAAVRPHFQVQFQSLTRAETRVNPPRIDLLESLSFRAVARTRKFRPVSSTGFRRREGRGLEGRGAADSPRTGIPHGSNASDSVHSPHTRCISADQGAERNRRGTGQGGQGAGKVVVDAGFARHGGR
jgi:hypothetical protein